MICLYTAHSILQDFYGRWENAHNGVHSWIGGTMARSLASSDPVFYMHHAFIDYQWEKFRKHQEVDCGIDPSFDYPPTNDENHAPESRMDGMSFLMNKDGIADYWTTEWYNYEDSPTCVTSCGNTPDLFCDPAKNLCVSEMRVDLNTGEKDTEEMQTDHSMAMPPPLMEQMQTGPPMAMPVSDCRKNLYARSCPGPPEPKTQLEYVERMVRKEIEMPPEIEAVDQMIKNEAARTEEFPPDSEPIFFKAAPDEPNDCRTSATSVFDLITAVIRGKKVTKRGYAGLKKQKV